VTKRYDEDEKQFKMGVVAERYWLLGKDHPYTLRIVKDLAVLCTRQKRYKEA